MPPLGYKMSEESKEKMRQAKLKNPVRYWLGKKISKEHFEKLHKARLEKAPTPHLGKTFTNDAKKRISETLKKKFRSGELISPLRKLGLIGLTGDKAMNWRGGAAIKTQRARGHLQYKIWRKSIWERDNFTCQKCKKRGYKLISHHIQNFAQYPALRFAIDNGITFCPTCHKDFHKRYSNRNNNYQQISEFLRL